VTIDAIIFGGRVRDREPLVRAITGLADGVYDGLTLGAEATAAADGKAGVLRYDPMSMRPFLSYSEGAYAQHWLDVLGKATDMPIFAHVNWFQRNPDGSYVWPGYGENLRALLWLMDLKEGRVQGRKTPIGVLPRREELNLEGLALSDAALNRLLDYDTGLWREEMKGREEHLSQFPGMPEEVWEAHRRMEAALASSEGSPK
jgi:phosphoenolpyruvate carboxykinase (GTP)